MLLSVENLSVSYGNIKALHGISFEVDKGEIVCIIGANGAGKSTTLRAISRLIPAESGSIMRFQSESLLDYPPDKVVTNLGISHVPEGRRLFENLTVMENLTLATFARKDTEAIEKDRERVFLIFPRLKERINQKAGTLSGGEQQMLAIARALLLEPKVLVLDEPSIGLAPTVRREIFDVIVARVKASGCACVLIEQRALDALRIADFGYVLNRGAVVLAAPAEQILADESLRQSYVGA